MKRTTASLKHACTVCIYNMQYTHIYIYICVYDWKFAPCIYIYACMKACKYIHLTMKNETVLAKQIKHNVMSCRRFGLLPKTPRSRRSSLCVCLWHTKIFMPGQSKKGWSVWLISFNTFDFLAPETIIFLMLVHVCLWP